MPYYPERPDQTGKENQQKRRTEKRKMILRLSLAAVSCALIVYGAVRLIGYRSELDASRQTSRELQQINSQQVTETVPPSVSPAVITQAPPAEVTQPSPAEVTPLPEKEADSTKLLPVQYPNNPELKMSDRFKALRKKGKYIVGWIQLDGVDEAVARSDNTFFLNHDATGKKNSNGAIFLDEGVTLTTRPYTLILYGHNMKSGNMFGRLKKYKESSYFYKNRIITFDTMYEDGKYEVFAVAEINTVPGTAFWYDVYALMTVNRADREDAIRTLEQRSFVRGTVDVQADDQLLLLVTCLDGDAERLVVAARRLREGET